MSRLLSLKRNTAAAGSATPLKQRELDIGISDLQRFQRLFRDHLKYVKSLLYRMRVNENDQDDLIQEIFLKIWKAQPQFNQQASWKTWITRVAINQAIDHFRSQKPEAATFEETDFAGDQNRYSFEARELAEKAIASLPADLRAAFILHIIEGFDQKETAEILGVPLGTIKSRVHNSRHILQKTLNEMGVNLES